MYAFRKPFTAARFEGPMLGDLELKTVLVISQIVGYTLSKYIGIRVCSTTPRHRRALMLLGLVAAAEASLVLFAVAPPKLMVAAIFLNGLPLGMVWGMVVSYLEGRRSSELLLAGLSCSFIVSSAVVKDVGRALMTHLHVSESWMPALTGLIFLPGFVLSVWLLDQLPQPSAEDVRARVTRRPMDAGDRRAFVKRFFVILALLLPVYFALTAYRDFRDNYGVEMLGELGYLGTPAIFTRLEVPVAFGVMAALAALNLVKDNRRGLAAALCLMAVGTALLGGATLMWHAGLISGAAWMILIGLGSYLAYVPFGSMLFDRLMAASGTAGTAVFAIYIADAVGYTGSVLVQLYRDLAERNHTRLHFFGQFTWAMAALGTSLLLGACVYFLRSYPRPSIRTGHQATNRPFDTAAVANEDLANARRHSHVEK